MFYRQLSIVLVACLIGCGDDGIQISGQVTFEGEAVEQGTISFIDTGSTAPPDAAVIANGSYSLQTSPGNKRVEIRASRPLPPERQTNPEMGLVYDDYIPAAFNRESTLTANVTPDGEREFDFHLTEQAKAN